MSAERWAMVRALVEETLTLSRDAQPAFLDRACGNDAVLREQIERLAAAYERADENWGFLAQPAGELVAPLIDADQAAHIDPATRLDEPRPAFCAALADRYALGAEIGRGGMATVYVADDLRNQRRVAIKVLHPDLVVMLGAQRFLTEIRVTANLQHPNLLPLFDSGEAAGLLYYVMPLIEGATLRDRLNREKKLPVDEAVRIVRAIASALDYAHRQGVVHRDLKPENILLQDGEPLVADFGIALAVTKAVDTQITGSAISLGTPKYMSPEQASGSTALDGRSDIFSLGCVLYELLTGDPPFTGSTAQAVIASVISDEPTSVRTLRPSVPAQVEAALTRALAKSPADRPATAREFADALVLAPAAVPSAARRILAAALATVALGTGGWFVFSPPPASGSFPQGKLIDHWHRSAVTMTPDGGALVYTGNADAGRPIMLRQVGQLEARAVAGTEGGFLPIVSHDGKRLAFWSLQGVLKSVPIEGADGVGGAKSWRYGNGGWVNDSVIVSVDSVGGLVTVVPGGAKPVVLTEPDTARGQFKHMAPLVLPDRRAVVFTAGNAGGVALVSGELAMASLEAGPDSISPHVQLGLKARRAVAFVNGWLLYIGSDGKDIMAVRLDQKQSRISGAPISVLHDESGNLEMASLADNGTLMYMRRPRTNSPMLADSNGAVGQSIARAVGSSFMHPRLSPDGKRFVAQQTFERQQDLWIWDIASRTPTRLTTTGSAYHPTWTPDGRRVIYWDAHLGFMSQAVDGGAPAEKIIGIRNVFGPMVTPDGKSVVFMRRSPSRQWVWQIWSASLNGETPPRQVFDDPGRDNYMPAISNDGKWLAYVSKVGTGIPQVYVRPYPGPGQAIQVSENGGIEPSWSADGRRINYLSKTALIQADVTTPALAITRRQLFDGAFDDHMMPHRNYDVARDGSGFLMIAAPGDSETFVVLNWLTDLRALLKRAR